MLWYVLKLLVLLPTLLAALYFFALAAPQYDSEARFLIRGRQAAPSSGLGEMLQTAGFRPAQEDAMGVRDYLQSHDAVAALRARADEIVSRVLVENEQRWESLSDADRTRMSAMARAIAGRLLHEPTLRLKRSSGEDDSYLYVSALRELFGLDADSAPAADADGEVRSLPDARARKRPAS